MITDQPLIQMFEVGAIKVARWPLVPAYSRYYDLHGVIVRGVDGFVTSVVGVVVYGPTTLAPGDLLALSRVPHWPIYRKLPLP